MRIQRLLLTFGFGKEPTLKSPLKLFSKRGIGAIGFISSSYMLWRHNISFMATKADERKLEISSIKTDKQKLRVKNLVFKGGGPKGLAYIGALDALEKSSSIDLNKVERVAGTSAGAIVAAALAVGYQPSELRQHITPPVMLSFVTKGLTEKQEMIVKKALGAASNAGVSYLPISPKIRGGLKALGQIARHPIEGSKLAIHWYRNGQALSDGEYFRNWLNTLITNKVVELELARLAQDVTAKEREAIKAKLEKEYANVTFGQLANLIEQQKQTTESPSHYKHLFIVGAQDSGQSGKVVKRVSTSEKMPSNPAIEYFPDLIIADMVRESMSIPLVFTSSERRYVSKEVDESVIVKGQAVGMDGGVLENYPYRLFDLQCYLTHPDPEKHPSETVKNPETLGFILYDRADIGNLRSLIHKGKVIWSSRGHKDTTKPEDKPHYTKKLASLSLDDPDELMRHVFIDNCGVSLIDFNLSPEKQEELIASGRKGVGLFSLEDAVKLKALQVSHDDINKEKTNTLLKPYSVLTNIDDYSPSQNYIKTHHYYHLQITTNHTEKGISGVILVGIGGSGKSQCAYYGARKYLENHFWQRWREGKLHDRDRQLQASKSSQGWLWDSSIKLPVIWIFAARSPHDLWESLCALATKLDDEKSKTEKEYVKKFERVKSKEKPSLASISELQKEMQNHSHFLWIFDDVTEEGLNQTKEVNNLGVDVYVPSQRFLKGHVWITTQIPSLRAADPNFTELSFNDGLSAKEAKKLLSHFTGYSTGIDSINHVISLLEGIPLSLVLSGAYIRDNNLSYDEFADIYQKHEKDLEEEFENYMPTVIGQNNYYGNSEAKTKKLKKPIKTTLGLVLKSLFTKPIDSNPTSADLLRFCSKLHGNKIDENLLYDYIHMVNPQWSDQKIKKHLQKLIKGSLSLIESNAATNKKVYRMHQITQSIINGEWQPVDTDIFSSNTHKLAIKDCLKILAKHFNELDMAKEEKFKSNQLLLPHVEKALSFYPDLSILDDKELIKVSLPLHRTLCFMKLNTNRGEEARAEADMLIATFIKQGKLAKVKQQYAEIYARLAAIDQTWPIYYAAMLYIAGREGFHLKATAHHDKQAQLTQQEESFNQCIALCDEIKARTGQLLHYKFLSERGKLRVQHDRGTPESLSHALEGYKQLLNDNQDYYNDEEGRVTQYDTDSYNQLICREHISRICQKLGSALAKTDAEEVAHYFKQADDYLGKYIKSLDEKGEMSFEVAARHYNSLAFLYFDPANPYRNLTEARNYFRKAYEHEMNKNNGKGKWDIYLADACYGLALIAKELALYSHAKGCAEISKEINEYLGKDVLKVSALLQAIDEETKRQPGESLTMFFKQPPSEISEVIREQLTCRKCLRP